MKRLTYWNEEQGCFSYRCSSCDVANALAAYERTGLTPDRITQLDILYKKGLRDIAAKDAEVVQITVERDAALNVLEECAADTISLYGRCPMPQENAPLTLDKLREMMGRPVWIVTFAKNAKDRWRILTGDKDGFLVFDNAVKYINDYGKTWLAYRWEPTVN